MSGSASKQSGHPPAHPAGPDAEIRLLRAALQVSRLVEPAEIANAIVSGACDLARAGGGFLYLKSPEGTEHRLLGCHVGADDPRRRGLLRLPIEELLSRAGFSTTDVQTGPSPSIFEPFGFERMVCVPGAEPACRCHLLLGAPKSNHSDPGPLGEVAVRFLAECLPALINGIRMERVRELVIKDDQTESYNRRYLDAFLVEEVERARRYGTALSLIFLDLDNLKAVNSSYGHGAGSRVLREVSARIISVIRGSDKLFRYGGDEFCVVLPETDAVGAFELAERLRQTIASRPFAVEVRTEVALTASFGVSSFPLHADSAAGLLSCADQALARVKLAGKNSIGVGGDARKGAGAV